MQNPTEAALIYTLTRALVASGVRPDDIAVITPYRQQIKLIQRVFSAPSSPSSSSPSSPASPSPSPDADVDLSAVEVLTADKAQGRDKAVVLVSLVRSNDTGNIGSLLRDWRRINVSFTRAKAKLVIFGSAETLSSDRLMADFVQLMEGRGWVLKLPEGAGGMHGEAGLEDEVKTGEEGAESDGEVKRRRAVVGTRMLDARPFVKELVEGEGE